MNLLSLHFMKDARKCNFYVSFSWGCAWDQISREEPGRWKLMGRQGLHNICILNKIHL